MFLLEQIFYINFKMQFRVKTAVGNFSSSWLNRMHESEYYNMLILINIWPLINILQLGN